MSIKEVTYYTGECDQPDCGTTTSDFGGDYSAWGDRDAAEEDWTENAGIVLDDGRAFCYRHAKGKRCDGCGDGIDVADLTEIDGSFFCIDCAPDEAS